MLERNFTITGDLAPAGATPTLDGLPARRRFRNGRPSARRRRRRRGLNFHDARGQLVRPYSIRSCARTPGSCAALHHARPEARRARRAGRRDRRRVRRLFLRRRLRRVVAGPAAASDQLWRARVLRRAAPRDARSCDPALFLALLELASYAADAAEERGIDARGWDNFEEIAPGAAEFPAANPDEIAYLQYSSGSTRFPHGVAVTHRALLDNLRAHGIGLEVEDTDRCISGCPGITTWGWSAACSRRCRTRSRPTSEDRGFRPAPARLARHDQPQPGHQRLLLADLRLRHSRAANGSCRRAPRTASTSSRWRLAGNGADMIRPDVMQAFVDAFADAGFEASAFCPSYGLVEGTWPSPSCLRAKGSGSSWSRKASFAAATMGRASARGGSARSSTAASRCSGCTSRSARPRGSPCSTARSARCSSAARR